MTKQIITDITHLKDTINTLPDGTYMYTHENEVSSMHHEHGYYVGVREIDDNNFTIVFHLHTPDNKVFGKWTDTHTGKVWLDEVQWCEREKDALALARKHDQLAVWDITHAKEIRL